MSNVSTKYSTAASSNTSLGGLSLAENKTRFKDINDLFRRLMADARQESNEVRNLIASARSIAVDAQTAAQEAQSDAAGATTASGNIAEQVAEAQSDASAAAAAAEAAEAAVDEVLTRIADAEATATGNSTALTALTSRVSSLESASATSAALVTVDNVTMSNTGGVLKAIDVAVGESTASALGQIGRTGLTTDADTDGLVVDGWYAVGGESVSGLPSNVTSGIVRVSSSYETDTYVQTLFAVGEEDPSVYVRFTVDGGSVWSQWREIVLASAAGSVLPEADEEDADRALSGSGTWMDVVHPAELQSAFEAIEDLETALESLRAETEAIQATVVAEPDGVTLLIEDGQYVVPVYNGATSESEGMAGLVPPADAGDEGLYLRGDGTWGDPQMSTEAFSGSDAGLVPPAEEEDQELFLCGDGSWADPTTLLSERIDTLESVSLASLDSRIEAMEGEVLDASIDAIFAEPEE